MNVPHCARNGACALAAMLLLAAAFNDFLSSHPAEEQNLNQFYCPPTRVRFFDAAGRFHWRPFVYRYELVNPLDGKYIERIDQPSPLVFFCEGYRYRILGWIPTSLHLIGCPAGTFYPLGTDDLGRDMLARVLAGARTSLLVVVLGILTYAALGCFIGAAAGLLGGWIDAVLMRCSEFVLALPTLYLILALRAILPLKMPFWQTLLLMVGTIAGIAWPPMARGVRGLILQIQSAAYVEAARALGCSRWQILVKHLFPALPPFIISQSLVSAPLFLLGEVTLSFLNVGFRDSGESWGTMLRALMDPRVLTDYWWNLAPMGCVFLTLYLLNLLSARRSLNWQWKRTW